MHNLRNVHRSLICSRPGNQLTASAWDVATDSLICAFGPTKANTLLELKRWKKYGDILQPVASWDAPCPLPDLDCDFILNLHYFSDTLTICLVLAGGDLVIVREEPQAGEEKIEIVGSVDAGISAAAWSPDEDLLAITTRVSTLLYMTRDFENLTDVTLSSDDLKASSHVSLGWGKKETQFKGKKARALRDPTVPETVDEGLLSDFDRKNTSLSWRGDGAYLAVNSLEANPRRAIRVYSREGVLDSVSEPVDGLIGALSWRPAGNLLAAIQRLQDHISVVFFERNGLRHGQFSLRLSKDEAADWGADIVLKWNVDSSVLAVCFRDRVQLWTMNNYHYYLKQEVLSLSYNLSAEPLSLTWHPERPLHLGLSSYDGIQRLAYASRVSRSSTSPPDDYGVVAVIDGKRIKLTPMRLANVPPPMALQELDLPGNAIDVAVSVDHSDELSITLAVLNHNGISLFAWPIESVAIKPPYLKWTIETPPKITNPSEANLQISFTTAETLLVLQSSMAESKLRFIDLKEYHTEQHLSTFDKSIEIVVESGPSTVPITYLIPEIDTPTQTSRASGQIEGFNLIQASDIHPRPKVALFPPSSGRIDAISCCKDRRPPANGVIHTFDDKQAEHVVFSLAENGSLFANQRCLVRSCTSFLVTPAHLILTTSQHLLKFVHLTEAVDDLEIPQDTPETDERCRSIERGARLVTVMPTIFALVLQMPRGNLETIYPRALVLAGIRDSINKMKYKKAFFACRNQRVDMNIIHDHAPQKFTSNVRLFVDQVKEVEHIDLFLSQLKEEDVSKSMYQETLQASPSTESPAIEDKQGRVALLHRTSKVNRICNAFLDALRDRSSSHFQNIVTAHVCKVPPGLDAGLAQIACLREQKSDQVDAAIEHICFLADVNRLYENALGLYDLELALLIAQKSQKDPREYLPFLQNLQEMSPLRRKYSIDDYLCRFSRALNHLCDLDAFDEVKNYAVKHVLYTEAQEHYRYQEGKLLELMRLHAVYFQQEGKFKEAGIAHEYLKDYATASESYRQAHLWKESLSCANLIPLPPARLQALARTLAESLIEGKDFHSAAIIYLDYLSDIPVAVRQFCKGYFFADALRIVGLHQRPELLESVIDAGLVEGMASMNELLADCKIQLNAQTPRIRELRAKKAEDPLAFFDGDVPGGADIPDNISLAPTDASTSGGGSLFTRYTNRTGTVGTNATRRTSKNRKREERKRARGKKGSEYEEEYLVNSAGRLIERINTVAAEVQRLVVGLMRRGMRERARAVESLMVEVVELCKSCVDEVFQSEPKDAGTGNPIPEDQENRPSGADGVLWDNLGENKPRVAPEVKDFVKLSLLGR